MRSGRALANTSRKRFADGSNTDNPSPVADCGFDTPLTPALAGGAREEHSGLLNHHSRSDAVCMSLRAHVAKQSPKGTLSPLVTGDCFGVANAPRNDIITPLP